MTISSLQSNQSAHSKVAGTGLAAGLVSAAFSDASTREGACLRGASWGAAGSGRVHRKGRDIRRRHAFQFCPSSTGWATGWTVKFSNRGTRMEDRELALIGLVDGVPRAVPPHVVKACHTYRQAVRTAKEIGPAKHMTNTLLAELAELIPQHVGDYLNKDDGPRRRDLPADAVARYERVVGNTLVSQWLAGQSQLTVLEELQAMKAAA